jgi:hypothetical protein
LYGKEYQVHGINETSYGEAAGIFGINCGHFPETFVDGYSIPRYDELTPEQEKRNEIEYAQSQQQRELEREIRQAKTEAAAYNAAGDKAEFQKAAAKVKEKQNDYKQFCEQTGRTPRPDRTQVSTYSRSEASKVSWSNRKNQTEPKPPRDFTPKPRFVDAKNVKEAEEAARKFGISADYSKFHVSVANAVNKTIFDIQETFGKGALSEVDRIGTFPQGLSTKWKGVYSPKEKSLFLRNVQAESSLEKWGKMNAEQKELGWWSTPSPLHVVRHELGHAIEAKLTKDQKGLITQYRDEVRLQYIRSKGKTQARDVLSGYGFVNTGEFIAESVAEYLDGNPRETAKTVVEMIMGFLK